jgi:hypothetical protein
MGYSFDLELGIQPELVGILWTALAIYPPTYWRAWWDISIDTKIRRLEDLPH